MSAAPAAAGSTLPPDEAARARIRTDLDTTLFVEAGAGSGKTTALVDRVLALVASGTAELAQIAAITFTEKAGAELRDRIRRALEEHAADGSADPEAAARCREALAQLDGAAIGTLHAFAQRLLGEHPVEAKLPPRVEVLDEVSSGIAFERRWLRTLDELLGDPDLERTLLLLDAAGVNPRKLRSLALAFDASWDLVEARIPVTAAPPPDLRTGLPRIQALMADLVACCGDCRDQTDRLVERIRQLEAFVALLAESDELDAMEALCNGRPSTRVSNCGNKKRWTCSVEDVRAKVVALGEALDGLQLQVLQAAIHHLGSAMRRHTLRAADARREAGRLEFHDLLVLARKLLQDPVHGADVRRRLHHRYQRLLLDEFQDTDPIQIELAVRIAAADPATAGEGHWSEVAVAPGHLFVVGDPKQSIYRFRRADIRTFLEAKQRFAPEAGGAVELTANFRTGEPIIDWVNVTFEALLQEPPDEQLYEPSQPDYVALDAQRPGPPAGPPVAVLGRSPHEHGTRADDLREREARDVARAVTVALDERWQVRDEAAPDGWRDVRAGDITILVPARTSLPFLEDALEAAGVPFRAESSSLVYASRAIRDLLMVLRAADDPTDRLAVVSALRTPYLGCGDDDLFTHRVLHKRSWAYHAPTPPDPGDGVVSAGLAFLRELHERRHWESPAELLDRIVRERRVLELGFADGRPRDVWRRVRFVVDQARAWSEATGGTLRAYLAWVRQQTMDGARVTEAVLPETDDDAVRIMTIHAAKGLEFPVTIVSGMSTSSRGQRAPVDVHFPRGDGPVAYRLGKEVRTQEFDDWAPIDEQMGYHERIRLLYVACTRARDHLVLSLHRAARKKEPEQRRQRTNAEVLAAGMGPLLEQLPDLGGAAEPRDRPQDDPPPPPPDFATWAAERSARLEEAGRPTTVAATALTDEGMPDVLAGAAFTPPEADDDPVAGLGKRPRDLDLPPWLKGRYGSAVGRAVHGTLQTVDLATGAGLEAVAAAQCQAEGIPGQLATVVELVTAALGSPVVREAAGARHWREVYACAPVGDRLLEGYVDLLYRGPHGLVVVDHKTAGTSDPAELDRRLAGYRNQGAAYALAVARSTGEPVVRVVFLYLTPDGAVERELTDLAGAVAEVERLVESGRDVVVA